MTMQPPYDAALREAVRIRMSPPNRESVAEIARDTGITAQTIYNWRSQGRNRASWCLRAPSHQRSGALPTSWRP
jgi:transposase-like protein